MTCAAQNGGGNRKPFSNSCASAKGNGSPNTPIVCVDDRGATLSVNPDPVIVHDVGKSDSKPVVIQWMTASGTGNLQISMRPGCTTALSCDGRGKCTARTIPHRSDENGERRCKYDVWTDTKPRLDPDTVVVKCCTVPEPAP
jgi:hypothetical protein